MRGFDIWQHERESAELLDSGLRVSRSDTPPVAKIWRPKAEKPSAHFRFRSVEAREAYITKYVADFTERRDTKRQHATDKRAAASQHAGDIDVGAVFCYSWGYDQTNIQYFQVIEKHGLNLTLREVAQAVVPGSEGFMCERVEPRIGAFLDECDGYNPRTNGGKPFAKRLQFTDEGNAYLSFEFGWCGQWRGGSEYQSHYA